MRDFNYKVWDMEDKKMYILNGFSNNGNYLFDEPVVYFYSESNPKELRCQSRSKVKILQPTGLTDMFSNEIYDGDILNSIKDGEEITYGAVIFSNGRYMTTYGLELRDIFDKSFVTDNICKTYR